MLFPLPMYPYQEYGASIEAGYICPVCQSGRLEAEEPDNPESSSLVCQNCAGKFTDGWRRHYWGTQPPLALQGTPITRLGGFYESIQSWSHPPTMPESELSRPRTTVADFVIDIDREHLWQAQEAARKIYDYLDAFAPGQIRVYYSGSKGFHIVVPYQTIGAKASATLLQREYKFMAVLIARKTGVIPDYKIYSPGRLLRVVDSWHPKTGRYKVELDESEIEEAELHCIAPRGMSINTTSAKFSEDMHELYLMAEEMAAEQDENVINPVLKPEVFAGKTLRGEPPCVESVLENGLPGKGTRHSMYFMLARYWLSSGLAAEVRGGFSGNTLVDGALLRGRQYAAQNDPHTSTPQSARIKDMEQTIKHVYQNDIKFSCAAPRSIGLCSPSCPIRQAEDSPFLQMFKLHQPYT